MKRQHIVQALTAIEPEFFDGLKEILKINSVKSEPKTHAPFGEGPKEALVKTLDIANKMGFKTAIINDAMGYAQLGDDNENYIGVVGHLDVVHEGDGWSYPPFDLTLDDGTFYGRGVLDNKGPILANLYALYALKKINYPFTKTIRIIFGTDEESGSLDIPLYLEKEAPPMYGYTPDCKYPAVYGERGVLGIDIKTTITDNSLAAITELSGNFDRSAIPDSATIILQNGEEINVTGKRSPSNAPDMGLNAITLLAKEIVEQNVLAGEALQYMRWLSDGLHNQHNGAGLGIDFSDEASGELSLSPYDLSINENEICLSISSRYPISVKEDDIIAEIKKHLPTQSTITITRSMPSVLFPVDHPMIDTMTTVYEEVTGLDGTPVTTTGATYARSMPNIMAFGPSFPGQKGIAHNKDEYMDKKDLITNLHIYGLLLADLGK
ncbi:Sapep family Mn(2+)-dependent dipeptidase [Vagococcus jeotgali]|uniref:Sapep family Mn(2+)-dependent dipeptidase n=1 Tax=Vagococcus jeotgali TaxID=3109030 RepID=UPI002DD7E909|nr:Sapep family Mn(2+)-dependent dipeptidase [Vagococcus sp. B2T-5]